MVCSLSNPEMAVSALSRTLEQRCLLSLEPWTGSFGSLSNPELAVSALSRTLDWQCRFTLEPWLPLKWCWTPLLSSWVHAPLVLTAHLTLSNSVVSRAVPVGNVSWILFQEGRSSNFS